MLVFQAKQDLWLHRPSTLLPSRNPVEVEEADECFAEMKTRNRDKLAVNLLSMSEHQVIITCENYSRLRVTAYVLKFIKLLRKSPRPNAQSSGPVDSDLTTEEVDSALVYWLKSSQSILPQMEQFRVWSQQFGLFRDDNGLWRCGGRLGNSELHQEAKHPVFLGKNSPPDHPQ